VVPGVPPGFPMVLFYRLRFFAWLASRL
jgi:hypothetical protein